MSDSSDTAERSPRTVAGSLIAGSAFLGFLQFTRAAVVSPLVGLMGEETAVPTGLAMILRSSSLRSSSPPSPGSRFRSTTPPPGEASAAV